MARSKAVASCNEMSLQPRLAGLFVDLVEPTPHRILADHLRWRAQALSSMAVRMLRSGEETGQLATLSSRVTGFYEAKLQRSPGLSESPVRAIIGISVVGGGLIVSVMTSLLSVSQIVRHEVGYDNGYGTDCAAQS